MADSSLVNYRGNILIHFRLKMAAYCEVCAPPSQKAKSIAEKSQTTLFDDALSEDPSL